MVKALNFPEEYVDPILSAINNGRARLTRSIVVCDAYKDYYEFAGCEWVVNHHDMIHGTIFKESGEIDKEALTVAVLKGKIEST